MKVWTFPSFEALPDVMHAFTGRVAQNSTQSPLLSEAFSHFPSGSFVQAEQTHSDRVACVGASDRGKVIPQVDALITKESGVCLVVRTADCAPIFLCDPQRSAIGIVHSGKKGTLANILDRTVCLMRDTFGSSPADIVALLGPCIRPPHYELDIPSSIYQQAREIGIGHFYDCRLDTASDLTQFYSYRMEKGHTGRHYSAICLKK